MAASARAGSVTGSLIDANADVAIAVLDSDLTLDTSVVRGLPASDARGGRGLSIGTGFANQGSTVTVRSSRVEQSRQLGVFIDGSQVTIETSEVRGTLPLAGDIVGRGIHLQDATRYGLISDVTISGSVIADNVEFGVAVTASKLLLEACAIEGTRARDDGYFGDGLVLASEPTPATATVSSVAFAGNARAAVANFGGALALGNSSFVCHQFDLDGEPLNGKPFMLEDLGNNGCGCPDPTNVCKAVSAGLQPPESLESR